MTASPDLPIDCDVSRKFVRVLRQSADGLVGFEFSIGWPELAVELVLPRAAFEEFCAANRVERLGEAIPGASVDAARLPLGATSDTTHKDPTHDDD